MLAGLPRYESLANLAPQDRPRFEAHCGVKEPYDDEEAALEHRKHLKKKFRSKDIAAMEAYQCDFCGKWHIGHPPGYYREKRMKKQAKEKR